MKKVLINIFHDKNSIIITKKHLEDFCKIDCALNAWSVIVLAEKNNYDLILMDINLGDPVNGIYLTKIFRKN